MMNSQSPHVQYLLHAMDNKTPVKMADVSVIVDEMYKSIVTNNLKIRVHDDTGRVFHVHPKDLAPSSSG